MRINNGVRFACFDFGLNVDGGLAFFEANIAGNWLWIEHATGQPISEQIARVALGVV